MFLKFLKVIVVVTIFIYISIFIYLQIKHPFWFSQPVAQYTDLFIKEGIITENIPKPLQINNFRIEIINIKDKKIINDIRNLLNTNYNTNNTYRFDYDNNYLNWSLNPPYKHYDIKTENKWSIGVYDKSKLISFINGKPIKLFVNHKQLLCFYIDYLCIDKKYRKKNLVQSMITQMANNGLSEYFKFFIFKKELFPLPFRFISNYNYYLVDINTIENNDNNLIKININKLSTDEIQNLYDFYQKNIQKYKLYNLLHYNEFVHYMSNNVSVYINKNGEIETLIGIYNSQIKYGNFKTCEFLFIILKNGMDYESVIDELLIKEKCNYQYCLINDMGNNSIYVKKKNLEKYSPCFLHFYNYNFYQKINSNEIYFNIP